MRILKFCDSACIFVHACHADFGILRFCMRFCAWLSCGFWDSVILHVFSRMLVMRILNSCVFACYFAIGRHADFEILWFRMLFCDRLSCGFWNSVIPHVILCSLVMQILVFCVFTCYFAPVCHADLEFLQFRMLFRSCLSCESGVSAIPHVVSRLVVMRFLEFCDSACIFAHACHADFGILWFRMLFRTCLSWESGVSAIPHVVLRMLVMRIWEFCDSAYYFVSVAGNTGMVGMRPRHDPVCRLLAVQAW